MLKITKKSTKVIITSVITFLMSALFALTGVGVGLAFWNKDDGNSKPTNPIIWSSDKYDGSTPDTSSWLKGDTFAKRGTKTYTINSARSFMKFVEIVNSDAAADYNYFREYTIYLNKNIDMNGYSFSPIGKKLTDSSDNAFSSFQGVFDGSYYTISNATINGNGLFGYVEDATIRNIGLYNCNIASDADYVGGLVGEAINTTIENSYVRLGSISANHIAGGLVGKLTIDRTKNTNLPQNLIVNSFVDTTIEANSFGGLVGEIVSNNDSAENNGTISYSYFTGNGQVTYINNPNIILDNVVDVKYGANFSAYNVRKYSAELLSETNAWTNYQHVENSPAMDFNYPMLAEFVKVFMTGSAYENVLVKDGKVENVTTLYEAFKEVEHNQDGEINIIVEQVTMDDTAVAGDGATVTLNAAVDTKILRNTASKTVEHMIVGATGSTLVLGDENATENSPKLVLDGQKDTVEENKLKSGALIFAQGEDFDIYSNVVLQNNINNTTPYGGAICVYDVESGIPKTGEDENTFISGVTISGVKVENCTAEGGGGIAIVDTNAVIENCEVCGNTATSGEYGGGGISIGIMTTNNRSFIETATKYGKKNVIKGLTNRNDILGASTISGSSIYGNSVSGFGGGVYAVCLNVTISNCSIYQNVATYVSSETTIGAGGAGVYCINLVMNGSAGKLNILDGTSIQSNILANVPSSGAGAGAGVMCYDGSVYFSTSSKIYYNGMVPVNSVNPSYAGTQGGGVWLAGCTGSVLSEIYQNQAERGGGIMFMPAGNESLTIGANIHNNQAERGGGIYIFGNDNTTDGFDKDGTCAFTSSNTLKFSSAAIITGNLSTYGGGVYADLGKEKITYSYVVSGLNENICYGNIATNGDGVSNGSNTYNLGYAYFIYYGSTGVVLPHVYYLDTVLTNSTQVGPSGANWVATGFSTSKDIQWTHDGLKYSNSFYAQEFKNTAMGDGEYYYATMARMMNFKANDGTIITLCQLSNYDGTAMLWTELSDSYTFSISNAPMVTSVTDWTTMGWVDSSGNVRAYEDSIGAGDCPVEFKGTTLYCGYTRTMTFIFKSNGGSGSMNNQTYTVLYIPLLSNTGLFNLSATVSTNGFSSPSSTYIFAGWKRGSSTATYTGSKMIENGETYTPDVTYSDSFTIYLWAQWTEKTWYYGILDPNGGTLMGDNTSLASSTASGVTYGLTLSGTTLTNKRTSSATTYNNQLQMSKVTFTTYGANQTVTITVTYNADVSKSYGLFGKLDSTPSWTKSTASTDSSVYAHTNDLLGKKTITYTVASAGSHYIYVGWIYSSYDLTTKDAAIEILESGDIENGQVQNPNSVYGDDVEISNNNLRGSYWEGYPYLMNAKIDLPIGTGYSNATVNYCYSVSTKGNGNSTVSSGTTKSYSYTKEGQYFVSGNNGVNYSLSLYQYYFTTKYPNTTVIFDVVNSGENNYDFAVFANLDTNVSSSASNGGWNWRSYSTYQFANFKGKSDANTTTNTTKQVVYQVSTAGSHYIMWGFRKDGSSHSYKDCAKVRIHQNTSNEAIATVSTSSNSDSATTYAYSIDSTGYYVSGNKGIKSSLALYKYTFTTSKANQTVNFDVISYGESGCDYAVFGNLDTDVSSWTYSSTTTNRYKAFTSPSATAQTLSYTVATAGTHYFMWGYRKDSSLDKNDDVAKLKLAYTPEVTVTEIYNQEIGYLPPVEKSGYEFVGWKSTIYQDLGEPVNFFNGAFTNASEYILNQSNYYCASSSQLSSLYVESFNDVTYNNYSIVGPFPLTNSSGLSWLANAGSLLNQQYIYEIWLYNNDSFTASNAVTPSSTITSGTTFSIPNGTTYALVILNNDMMASIDYNVGDAITYQVKNVKYYNAGDYIDIKANNNLKAMWSDGKFVSSSTLSSEMKNLFGYDKSSITGIRFDTYATIASYNQELEDVGDSTYEDTGLRLSTGIPIYRQGTSANFAFVLDMDIKWTSLASYFSGWSSLKSAVFNNLNFQGCTSLNAMFYNCTSLTKVSFASSCYSTTITNLSSMFFGCVKLVDVNIANIFNASSTPVDASYMFSNCHKLTGVTLPFTNMNKLSSISCMFNDCYLIEKINLSSSQIKNASASCAFLRCSKLESISFASGSSITSASSMFSGCSSLESLNISNIDFANCTTTSYMFQNCSKLKSITGLDTIGVAAGKLTSMSYMFYRCSVLEKVSFSQDIDTSTVTTFTMMFYYCTGLKYLKLNGFTFSSGATVTNMLNFGTNNKILYITQDNITNDLGTDIPITTHTSTSRLFDSLEVSANEIIGAEIEPVVKTVLGTGSTLVRGSYLTFDAGSYSVIHTEDLQTNQASHQLTPYNTAFTAYRIVMFYSEGLDGVLPTSQREDGYYLSYWVKSGTNIAIDDSLTISEDTVVVPYWTENQVVVNVKLEGKYWNGFSNITSVNNDGVERDSFMTLLYFKSSAKVGQVEGTVIAPSTVIDYTIHSFDGNSDYACVIFSKLPVGAYFIMAPVSTYNLQEVPCGYFVVSSDTGSITTTLNYYNYSLTPNFTHPGEDTPEGSVEFYSYPTDKTTPNPYGTSSIPVVSISGATVLRCVANKSEEHYVLQVPEFTYYTGTDKSYSANIIGTAQIQYLKGWYRYIDNSGTSITSTVASGAGINVYFKCVQNLVRVISTPTDLTIKVQLYRNGTAVSDVFTSSSGITTITGIDTGTYDVWASATTNSSYVDILVPTGYTVTVSGGTTVLSSEINYANARLVYGVKLDGSKNGWSYYTRCQLRLRAAEGGTAIPTINYNDDMYIIKDYDFEVYAPEVYGGLSVSTSDWAQFTVTKDTTDNIKYINYGVFTLTPRLDYYANKTTDWLDTYTAKIQYTLYRNGLSYSSFYKTISVDSSRGRTTKVFAKGGLEFDVWATQVIPTSSSQTLGSQNSAISVTAAESSSGEGEDFYIGYYTVQGVASTGIEITTPGTSTNDYYILETTTFRTTTDGSKVEVGNGGSAGTVLFTYALNPSTGYTSQFLGWVYTKYLEPTATLTTTDVLVNVPYTVEPKVNHQPKSYYIKYNSDGGSGTMENSKHTYGVSSNLTANNFTRSGYHFLGWSTMASSPMVYATNAATITTTVNSDNTTLTVKAGNNTLGTVTNGGTINLYAVWAADTYTIAYNGNGSTGGSTASSTHTYSETKTLTANGFAKTYNVDYYSNGELVSSVQCAYTFAGWTNSASSTTVLATNGASITTTASGTTLTVKAGNNTLGTVTNGGTITLYAVWTVKFTLTSPADREGYTFNGWYTAATGGTLVGQSGAEFTPTEDTNLYAHWTINSQTVTYNATENGGTFGSASGYSSTATVNYGAAVDVSKTNRYGTKSGWTFVGWNIDQNATTALSSYTMGTSDVTLYAIYSKTYTAKFIYYNNETAEISNTIYNKETDPVLTAPGELGTPSGCSFRGWSTDKAANAKITLAASDPILMYLTYYASYQKTVTATFYYSTLTKDNFTYSVKASTATAAAIQYLGYTGTIINSNFTVPSAVTSSTGGASAENYIGVANAINSATVVTPTTANTKFYAVYTESLTFYYYYGTAHTSTTLTRRMLCDGTNYANSLSATAPTPSNYNDASFTSWQYQSNPDTDYTRGPLSTGVSELFAKYTLSVTATFNYYDGSKAATATASAYRYYVSKNGGINTTENNFTIPTAVSANRTISNVAYTYRGVSTATTANAAVATPTTANTAFYASYTYTVKVTFDGNNATSGTTPTAVSGTAYMNYKADKVGLTITVPANPFGRTGYALAAKPWNTNAAGTGTGYSANAAATFTANTTLYAAWTANELTFSAQELNVTYSTSAQTTTFTGASNGTGSYTYSITAGNTGSYFTISGTTITVKASTPVNTYNLTVHVVDNGSGKTKDATITIIVKKAAGSISYATKTITKTYGDAAFTNALTKVGDGTVTYSSSATGVATVDGTGKVTIKGAGTTTITATVADGTSYTYATKTATYTLTVNKKTLTVTAANKTITYGDALPSYTYSITGFVNNETESVLTTKPTATCSYVRYGNVGTYDITASGAAAANYSFSYVNGKLTVNKLQVTATWPSTVSFVYDGGVHKVEATIGNLVNNDAVTFTYTGTTSATAAGEYTAKISGLSGTKAGNYSLPSNLEQNWSIGTASVILTVDSSKTVVYGSTATVSYKSNVAGKFTITSNSTSYVTVATGYTQTVEANKAYTFTINGVKAGSGTITVAFAPTDSKNYTAPANKTVNVTVDRATIANVPSQSGTLTYNGNAQSPSWNNYDSVKMTIGGTTSGTNVGTYAATFTPTSNYKWSDGTTTAKTVNWSIGKLVVTKPTAKTNLTYTGSSITGVTFSTGVGYSVKSGSTAAINAGNYSAVFTLDGNHTWSDGTADVTVNWSIAKKSVAVVWGTTTSWIYDGQSHIPTASATGVTGETLNLTVKEPQTNASSSSYTATATLSSVTGGQALTSNYTLTNTTKAFTISARAITVTANSASKVYDGTALTDNGATVTSDTKLVSGHKLSYTITGTITNVGSVANVISNVKVLDANNNDVSSNYKITSANGTLTITAKVTTFAVTLKETSYVYDGNEKQPTITVKAGNVTLTTGTDYTVSGTTNTTKVGNYTITITGAGNYAGSNGSATWTITKATVTVPTAPADKTYTGVSQNSGITNPTHSSIVAASSTTSATNVGSYNVVLKLDDADNYQWNDETTVNKTIVWKIVAKSLKDCTVTLAYTTVDFDGTAKTPAVTVKIGSTTIANSNYTVNYTNNTNVGTAKVTISGNTNLKDTVELTFTIKAVGYTINYTKMINNVETTLTTTNKTGYDVSTSAQTISLTAPTLAGHTFTGWTITNTASTSKATLSGSTVTIPANSYGAFKLTAHFTVNNYTISYNYDGGKVTTANKTTYQISANAQTFTLNVPTKSDYRFTSWTLTNTDSTTSKATVSGNTVTIPANSYGNFAIKANYEQVISVTLQIIKPESSKASYSFAEYETSNDAINNTNVITSFTMDGATTSTSNGITTITKQIVVGKDYYLAIVSAKTTAAVGNKYELLCVYNNEQLLTEMPVKTISGANASGRYKITASTTIKLEFFSAVKVDLEATATETDSTKLVGWTNVTVETKDGKEEIENSQYIIREGATWKAKIDSTHLGAEDALMGIKYVLADGTTGTTTTTGDDNIKYDSANEIYIISADVVTLTPIVKTPIELEVVSSNVTLTETKDKIVKNRGSGTIKVYAGTWELTFSGEDTPASASDVANTVFGVTNVTVDSTTGAASWTSSNGKWKFTVSKNSTDGKYYLTIASV